jgi:hypothetical protein
MAAVTWGELNTAAQKLKAALADLKGRSYVGLCSNLLNQIPLDDHIPASMYKEVYSAWPEFSGDVQYPVPSPLNVAPYIAYRNEPNMYSGEYGEARKRLLDFIIEYSAEKAA